MTLWTKILLRYPFVDVQIVTPLHKDPKQLYKDTQIPVSKKGNIEEDVGNSDFDDF